MKKKDEGARRRALRAARVVTLGLVMATPGCYLAHDVPEPEPVVMHDAGTDAGPALADAGTDAGLRCDVGSEGWTECCEAIGWDWERGCAAWGPFVPPGEAA